MPQRYALHPDTLLANGLTVRQELAARALAGILAHTGPQNWDELTDHAVAAAEELILKLNEEQRFEGVVDDDRR